MTTFAGYEYDEEAFLAAVMLVGHTGARDLEFGYLRDGVPTAEADWWAKAQYRGDRIIEEHHAGPVEAVEALARRVLTGGKCKWCGGLVAMSRDGAVAFPGGRWLDGAEVPDDRDAIAALGQCQWRRRGQRWEPGCIHGESSAPGAPQNRHDRRRLYRAYEQSRPGV